jgi:hypothetical protein
MHKPLGQIAYEAYCASVGWKSAATGTALPQWDKLPAVMMTGWSQAAGAVKMAILTPLLLEPNGPAPAPVKPTP